MPLGRPRLCAVWRLSLVVSLGQVRSRPVRNRWPACTLATGGDRYEVNRANATTDLYLYQMKAPSSPPFRQADLATRRRERLAALRYLPKLMVAVWRTHKGLAGAMVFVRAIRALLPVATLWVGKLLVDSVVGARSAPSDMTRVWTLIVVELLLVLAAEIFARASALLESLLGELFSNRMAVRLMEHAATLDLVHFEDAAFYDSLNRAHQQSTGRLKLLVQVLGVVQDFVTLLALAIALAATSPWLFALLVISVFPVFLGETHFASLAYSLLFSRTPKRRQLDYLRLVGLSDKTAKEVQVFGLSAWLIRRYKTLANELYDENRGLSTRRAVVSAGLSAIGTLGYYGAYCVIVFRAVTGAITLGSLTFLAAAFSKSRDLVQRILLSASDVFEESLHLRDLFGFFDMRPTVVSRPSARPVPTTIVEGFAFENVGFRYAGSDEWALHDLSFRLRPGERIALVGENGAGKTTVIKLLARLYEPTEGRITLDGVDLRDYDLASVRRAIGVIFQDFVRYDMRFDENIAIGQIELLDNVGKAQTRDTRRTSDSETAGHDGTNAWHAEKGLSHVSTRIQLAAQQSLASTLLSRFPDGYEQMLGRRFDRGIELSGGEWQRVALARAHVREAQVLILDEPTAALDPRAEYEVFVRFSSLMAGRMAVLISHRFSTVRIADRIIVLAGGTLTEEGTHDSLIARGGAYAELFALQAAGYR